TRVWATRADARRDVFAYLTYYNHQRLHSTLNHRTPHETRACYVKPTPSRHETPVTGPRVELQASPPCWPGRDSIRSMTGAGS
ncbi:IS3 family transposase, partial [Micromonospora sp. ALFpr18c]|uniref:IS3 family transposase n=1 Tax=Micromonospora sp. ALFpr18c TaxID=1458665 RepID=UPI00351A0BD7